MEYQKDESVGKDVKEAARWYQLLADQDDPDAQYHLAICYRDGEGVEKDMGEAMRWFMLSVESGWRGLCRAPPKQ